MKTRFQSCLFLMLLAGALVLLPVSALPARADLDVRSAMLIDMDTRRVLYQQNPDAPIPPASLTKILSMFIAMDHIRAGKVSLNDRVKVSRTAARQGGSRMYLKTGERVTLDRLLMGMAVSSGNDASVAVAEHVAGSQSKFVRMMNDKMRQLGLKRSVFKNPNGLPASGQITTAREMAFLAHQYLKSNPSAVRYHKTRALRHNGVVTTNKNPLLSSCEGADGLKTGWVTASGYNIVSTVKRGNMRVLAVILGAPSSTVRAKEVLRLVEAGFDARKDNTVVASILDSKRNTVHVAEQNNKKTKKINKSSSSKKNQASVSKKSKSKKRTQVARTSKASKAKTLADRGDKPRPATNDKARSVAQKSKKQSVAQASSKQNAQRASSKKTASSRNTNAQGVASKAASNTAAQDEWVVSGALAPTNKATSQRTQATSTSRQPTKTVSGGNVQASRTAQRI